MSILVDASTKKILGASLLGIETDEVIHCILDVIAADAPYMADPRDGPKRIAKALATYFRTPD